MSRSAGDEAQDDALFLSDVHFGARDPDTDRAREERLFSFLDRRAPRTRRLFLLGDIFDFWFDYRHVVPRRPLEVVRRLADLRDRGVELFWFGGNHDFWADGFMRLELGARVHEGPTGLEVAGRRLFLMHGDGMATGDPGYRLLKGVLRSRWAIAAYGMLHPDLAIPFALSVSHLSRGSRDEGRVDREWLFEQLAVPRFAEGHDAVLTGHYHHPTHLRRDGRDFLILGDWVTHFTYASLRGGVLRLEHWTGERAEEWSGEGREYPTAPAGAAHAGPGPSEAGGEARAV